MPVYELKYFNVKGRGEIVRLTLAIAGQEFKDTRYEFSEWAELKESTPSKALPVLFIDNKPYSQSIAIARFLAKKYELYGKCEAQAFVIDEVIDCLLDVFNDIVKVKFAKDEMKEDLTNNYKKTCARIFEYLESKLQGCSSHHFVGDKVSLADIACFVFLESPLTGDADLLKKFPKLAAVREHVAKLPKAAAYLEKRPVTDF